MTGVRGQVAPGVTEDQVGERIEQMRRRPQKFRDERVTMAHGAGGKASRALVEGLIVPLLSNPALEQLSDAGLLTVGSSRLALTTDAYVVRPIRFPGGSIGELAVNGTVNDLAVSGARPLALSAALVLEEGLEAGVLEAEISAMAQAARVAEVNIITGDTKVVERGKGDGVFISTTGLGVVAPGVDIAGSNARPGDVILLSGTIGEHGVAVLSQRESLEFETTIESDTAALHTLVAAMLEAAPGGVRVLRDPTRGGLATTLNEVAGQSRAGMMLDESAIPVLSQVDAACELLGLDPLYIANEGKLIAVCAPEAADAVLAAMRAHPQGRAAVRIGVVTEDPHHFVQMTTRFGGRRVVDWLSGEQLPRIC